MKITVIGAGKSGMAAALLAKKLGNDVFLTESGNESNFSDNVKLLKKSGIEFEFGGNTEKGLIDAGLIITSPGVQPSAEIIRKAEAVNIPIISELEFACRNLSNPIIAVTGTNGKTTTKTLITYILNNGGKKATAAGNIGTPLSSLVGKISDDTIIVAEVSSYQLDRVDTFRPDVALILNISPDHISYHGGMDEYISAKWKITSKQSDKNLLILNADDKAIPGGQQRTVEQRTVEQRTVEQRTVEQRTVNQSADKQRTVKHHTAARIALFSASPVDWGIYIEGDNDDAKIIISDYQHKEELMSLSELSLPGIHNAYNSMAAALAARAFEITNEDIRDSLLSFAGVEHRLEFVRTIDGVEYINDSKATNVNATWFALKSYKKPIIWLAGGRGDSNDYSSLGSAVEANVKSIVAFGEEADNIFNHFCLSKRCHKENTFEEAIMRAKDEADDGDIVLFTPSCKSFDMFMNFEQRGEAFKDIVNSIG